MAEYHALVAGMPVVAATDTELGISIGTFRDDYMPQLTEGDRRLVALYLHRYDNRNLLAVLRGEDKHDDRGMYSRQQLEEAVHAVANGYLDGRELVPYIYDFIDAYNHLPAEVLPEDALAAMYMQHALKAGNDFIRRWFEFERNIGNIIVAITARKVGIDATHALVGDDDVTERLRTSKEPDFGLKTEIDYFRNVEALLKGHDPVNKERALDELKWRWLDEETFFHYFSVEKVFAFLVKLDIVERWSRLDAEHGQQLFRQLIDGIKGGAELPEEFR